MILVFLLFDVHQDEVLDFLVKQEKVKLKINNFVGEKKSCCQIGMWDMTSISRHISIKKLHILSNLHPRQQQKQIA